MCCNLGEPLATSAAPTRCAAAVCMVCNVQYEPLVATRVHVQMFAMFAMFAIFTMFAMCCNLDEPLASRPVCSHCLQCLHCFKCAMCNANPLQAQVHHLCERANVCNVCNLQREPLASTSAPPRMHVQLFAMCSMWNSQKTSWIVFILQCGTAPVQCHSMLSAEAKSCQA